MPALSDKYLLYKPIIVILRLGRHVCVGRLVLLSHTCLKAELLNRCGKLLSLN